MTFTLKYRLYDYMDHSDTITFGAFVLNDQNAITPSPFRAGRYSFVRQNADLAGRYQLMPGMALTLGVGWEGWNRSHDFEVTQSDEALAKAAFDYTPNDWLLARLSYTAGFRRGNGYNTNAFGEANGNQPPTFNGSGSQETTMRKFNEGDRNQQVLNLMLQITPTDTLTFTPSASYKYANYVSSGLFDQQAAPLRNQSLLGVQRAVGWNAGMDINWTPSDRITFSTGYVHESTFHKQRNRNNSPDDASMDWISDSTDTVDTFHGSVKATILPQKLVFKMNGSYSQALTRVETYSPNATGSPVYAANGPNDIAWRWPAFYDSLARIDAALEYNLSKAWTAKLFYIYEQFINHNWQTGPLTPFLGPSVGAVFLGQHWQNYTAQIVGVTLKCSRTREPTLRAERRFRVLPLRHRLPGQHAGAAVVIHRHLAIDEHVGDADRVLAGVVEGGGVHHPLGVEQRDVGVVALLDAATLGDAEAPGRTVGHAVHHALHRDGGELAPQAAQEARERPVRARVRHRPGRGDVAADHEVVARDEVHGVLAHSVPEAVAHAAGPGSSPGPGRSRRARRTAPRPAIARARARSGKG